MSGFRFDLNRSARRDLTQHPDMGRALGKIADEAASEVERRLPYPRILGGVTVEGDTDRTSDAYEGVVRIAGHGWHLWEYGTVNHGSKPAIRPGVQATITRYGGRWTSE